MGGSDSLGRGGGTQWQDRIVMAIYDSDSDNVIDSDSDWVSDSDNELEDFTVTLSSQFTFTEVIFSS